MSNWTKFESLNVGPTRMINKKAQIRFADLLLDGVFGNKFIVTDDTRRFRAGYGGGGGGANNEDNETPAGEWRITPDPPPPETPKRSGLGRPPGALSASTKAAHENDKGLDLETGAVYPMVKPEFLMSPAKPKRAKSVHPAKRSASTPAKPATGAANTQDVQLVHAATKLVKTAQGGQRLSTVVGPRKPRSRAITRAPSPAPSGGGGGAAAASSGGAEDSAVIKADEVTKDDNTTATDVTGLTIPIIFKQIYTLLDTLLDNPTHADFVAGQKNLLKQLKLKATGTDAAARKAKIGDLQNIMRHVKLRAGKP